MCARVCTHACTQDTFFGPFPVRVSQFVVVINVLSPRACALDIEMRAEMPKGRGKEERDSKVAGEQSCGQGRQAAGTFARGLGVFQPGAPSANERVIRLCYFMVQKQIRSAASALP